MNQSYEQISKSPLNHSTAKQLYSFPKAKRFMQAHVDPNCQQIYNLPSTISKRGAGIGYGQRNRQMDNHNNTSPGPNQYDIKPELTARLEKNQGWTISVGRDQSNKYDSIFLSSMQKYPGPGQYKFGDTLSNVKYTMRQRTESYHLKDKRPGPGQYNLPNAINENGKYTLSQFRDSGAIKLSQPNAKAQRFYTPTKEMSPGPGTYEHNGDIDPMGLYYCSKFQDSKANRFTKAKRVIGQKQKQVPGPGDYRLPSEFGYYDQKSTITSAHN